MPLLRRAMEHCRTGYIPIGCHARRIGAMQHSRGKLLGEWQGHPKGSHTRSDFLAFLRYYVDRVEYRFRMQADIKAIPPASRTGGHRYRVFTLSNTFFPDERLFSPRSLCGSLGRLKHAQVFTMPSGVNPSIPYTELFKRITKHFPLDVFRSSLLTLICTFFRLPSLPGSCFNELLKTTLSQDGNCVFGRPLR